MMTVSAVAKLMPAHHRMTPVSVVGAKTKMHQCESCGVPRPPARVLRRKTNVSDPSLLIQASAMIKERERGEWKHQH